MTNSEVVENQQPMMVDWNFWDVTDGEVVRLITDKPKTKCMMGNFHKGSQVLFELYLKGPTCQIIKKCSI